ncbi:MAG: C39 family peptidase [Parcubacteria group bacterium]
MSWIWSAAKGLMILAGGFIILSVVNPGILTISSAPLDLLVDPLEIPPPLEGSFFEGIDFGTGLPIYDTSKVLIEPGKITLKWLPEGVTKEELINDLNARITEANIQGVDSIKDESVGNNISIVITIKDGFDANTIAGQLLTPRETGELAPSDKLVYTAAVPQLYQGQSPWGDKPICVPGCPTQHTFRNRGCGPTSLAMTILYLTKNQYLTKSTAVQTIGAQIVKGGMKKCNGNEPSGVYSSAFTRIPKSYGLTSTEVNNQKEAKNCFLKGGVMIGSMAASNDDPKDHTWHPQFTDYAHYIVVKGIDETKNLFIIADPGGRTKSSEIAHYFKRDRATWCISGTGAGGKKADVNINAVCENGCTSETDTAFCSRRGLECGSFTGPDNCGKQRTVSSCGSCGYYEVCGAFGPANTCNSTLRY